MTTHRQWTRGDTFRTTDSDLEFVLINYDGEQAIVAKWNPNRGGVFFTWPAEALRTLDGLDRTDSCRTQPELRDIVNALEPAL